ncbi:Uncharacterised protein [Candidatus Gugararchaeum adminiculabundum]|nr:Uncharacterised protein [Candidatus Gugararchaeum adminiculabundum]
MAKEIKIAENEKREIDFSGKSGDFAIQLAQGAQATILDLAQGNSRNLRQKIILGKNSRLTMVSIQNQGADSDSKTERKIACTENSEVHFFSANLGGKISAEVREIHLQGKGAKLFDNEIFFGTMNQHFQNNTAVFHEGANTFSRITVKGLLGGVSSADYLGLVKIEKSALNSDTFLAQHTLLLDTGAKAEMNPNLEIENSEIKAGHSASASKISEDDLFYLQSRGIPKTKAATLLASGFLAQVIEKFPKFSSEIESFMQRKWGAKNV